MKAEGSYLDCGHFTIDVEGRMLVDPVGREVTLRRREFDLLATLARNPGRVMSRTALLDAIAGREAELFDRAIDVYIGRLRRKIEADPTRPRLVVTVPGVGYRLAAEHWPARAAREAHAETPSESVAICAGVCILDAHNRAQQERNAGALCALYTSDAVMFTPDGPISGRPAIGRRFDKRYKSYTPKLSTLNQVKTIGSDTILRAGTWSGIHQGENGPEDLHGYWTTTDLRHDGDWKICQEMWNLTSPLSVADGISAGQPPPNPPALSAPGRGASGSDGAGRG